MKPRSQHLQKSIADRILYSWILLILLGYFSGIFAARQSYILLVVTIFCGFAFIYYFIVIWAKEISNYSLGIRGEIKVGAILALLPKNDFTYLPDIVLSKHGFNIDHIVVGKTGVWLIEVKHWRKGVISKQNGVVLMDGKSNEINEMISYTKNRAGILQNLFNENNAAVRWVQPVLVFSQDNTKVDVADAYDRVYIVGFRELADLISNHMSTNDLDEKQRAFALNALDKFILKD